MWTTQQGDNLQPFSGFGLLESDHLVIQRDACGSSATTDISPDNQLGTGFFQPLIRNGLWVTLILTFGTSDGTSDYHVEIDACLHRLPHVPHAGIRHQSTA